MSAVVAHKLSGFHTIPRRSATVSLPTFATQAARKFEFQKKLSSDRRRIRVNGRITLTITMTQEFVDVDEIYACYYLTFCCFAASNKRFFHSSSKFFKPGQSPGFCSLSARRGAKSVKPKG